MLATSTGVVRGIRTVQPAASSTCTVVQYRTPECSAFKKKFLHSTHLVLVLTVIVTRYSGNYNAKAHWN